MTGAGTRAMSFGKSNNSGRVWASRNFRPAGRAATWVVGLKGRRPASNGQQKYQSLYVYGFAEPRTGRNLCLVLPKANAEQMGKALADFAAWADPAGRKVLVVLVDNAGWHVAKKLAVPADVVLHRLPPHRLQDRTKAGARGQRSR